MHAAAWEFIRAAVHGHEAATTLEIGSLDVNGSIRDLFCGEYLGIDRLPGRGVDLQTEARDYDGEGCFALVISAEALEHAENPAEIIACASRALQAGGLFVLTCASAGRAPHGCRGGALEDGECYHPINSLWLCDALECNGLDLRVLEYYPERGDLYAVAVREG